MAIDGTSDDDNLTGTAYPDTINGLEGNDTINAAAGNDILNGGDGSDYLDGGSGADQLIGGLSYNFLANDIYVVDNAGDVVTEPGGGEHDAVISSISYTLPGGIEHLSLIGTAEISGTGNNLTNFIKGNSYANTLYGLAGNDYLDGNLGADKLIGGLGNDRYYVDNIGDVVTELVGQGTDEVVSNVTYTLPAEVEDLTLIGSAMIHGFGNNLNNVIFGNSGSNHLDGRGGADQFRGGLGDDSYMVDNAGDVVTELASQGTDVVRSTITYTLPAEVENLILGDFAVIGTGNNLPNAITGNENSNTLNGGGNRDELRGYHGADTFLFKFGESSIFANDIVTDFVIGSDKIDLLTQGGGMTNAPTSFSRAADFINPSTLQVLVDQVFIDANGELAGNQPLGINSAALIIPTNHESFFGTYLVINDATPGFQASNDLVINLITYGTHETLPPVGAIPVSYFFI